MMLFEWNSLRPGDAVRLHRDGQALEQGEVVVVDARRGSNGLSVRIGEPGRDAVVVRPSRMAVHPAAGPLDEPCLRCEALA